MRRTCVRVMLCGALAAGVMPSRVWADPPDARPGTLLHPHPSSRKALPATAPGVPMGGPGGPAPFGAPGPPPLGAAGPPPLGAAGPPPLGAPGPPPLGAAGPAQLGSGAEPHLIDREPRPIDDAGIDGVADDMGEIAPDE